MSEPLITLITLIILITNSSTKSVKEIAKQARNDGNTTHKIPPTKKTSQIYCEVRSHLILYPFKTGLYDTTTKISLPLGKV